MPFKDFPNPWHASVFSGRCKEGRMQVGGRGNLPLHRANVYLFFLAALSYWRQFFITVLEWTNSKLIFFVSLSFFSNLTNPPWTDGTPGYCLILSWALQTFAPLPNIKGRRNFRHCEIWAMNHPLNHKLSKFWTATTYNPNLKGLAETENVFQLLLGIRNMQIIDFAFWIIPYWDRIALSLSGGLAAHEMGNGQNSGAKNFNEFSTTDSFNLSCQSPAFALRGSFPLSRFYWWQRFWMLPSSSNEGTQGQSMLRLL